MKNKIISFEGLSTIRKCHPHKKIVHCHGVFDLLHYGHVLHLESAKKFGDILVITITPDRFVNKGPGRPHYNDQKRAVMLASLENVNYVAINKYPKAMEAIAAVGPDFYVKGPDYRDKGTDITGGIFEEEDAVKKAGGQLVFTEDETESSTELLNHYFNRWDDTQREAIEKIKVSLGEILETIDSFEKLRVLVVGEPIVDHYVFCQAEALSSKSPTVSARFLYEEKYAGGSLAIANNLCALGCHVGLLITSGQEDYFTKLLTKEIHKTIDLEIYSTVGIPTPLKTRYLTPFRAQRIFEMINIRSDQWLHVNPKPFCHKLREMSNEYDVVIMADFGHGMFEGEVLCTLSGIKKFIALNVQTNSGNFGFNPFTKHKRFNYLSLDERECRLATHDRFTPIEILARKTVKKIKQKNVSVTLGTGGSIFFDIHGKEYKCPTFFKDVIDTTGAGDAYFAITSLLVRKGVHKPLIPFIGNCYAGLKTRIMGNKESVSKVDLIRTVKSILK